jgi:RimJ/RimL family protein N-acetyltransferase
MFRTEFWGKGYATEAMEYWLQAWWKLPRREVDIKLDNEESAQSTAAVPEVLKADIVVTNHASKRILERFGFIPVHEEMVDDHQVQGQKIKLITLELQRPQ